MNSPTGIGGAAPDGARKKTENFSKCLLTVFGAILHNNARDVAKRSSAAMKIAAGGVKRRSETSVVPSPRAPGGTIV